MERVRGLYVQRVWAQAAEVMGLRQYVRTDISLGNSAEFFNRLDETLECDNSTLHPFHSAWNFQRKEVQSEVKLIRGSSDEVELMFVYCDGGSTCSCKAPREQWYWDDFCPLLCENLRHLYEVVPLKVRHCKCAAHATVQLARAVVGMHDAQSTVLEISLTSSLMFWLRKRMSRHGFKILIEKLLKHRLKWHLYPKNPFTLLDCSFQSALRKG